MKSGLDIVCFSANDWSDIPSSKFLERSSGCVRLHQSGSVPSAVAGVLASGYRTRDLAKPGENVVSTAGMGQRIAQSVRERPGPSGQRAAG